MADRKSIPTSTQTDLFIQSARRCCICFGLNHDYNVKQGQIAHLDHNPSNNDIDNLAFLCLDHHDNYDSKTKQSKNFTIHEVKSHRQTLYSAVSDFKTQAYSNISKNIQTQTQNVINETDVKSELRNLLYKINPIILERVDEGHKHIDTMISSSKLGVLLELTSEPNFNHYLQILPTGNLILGGTGNQIGNAINDIHEGVLTGYMLIPTDNLKK